MIEIIDGGYYSSIQDLGRIGWGQYGVPRSGAMDEFALRAANRLVGNPDSMAAIEVGLGGIHFRALRNLLIAVCGLGFSVWVDKRRVSLWQSFYVDEGQSVRVIHEGGGMWAVVGIHGGIDVPPIMGSNSTSLVGGFGGWLGRLLREGDYLPIRQTIVQSEQTSEKLFSRNALPEYSLNPNIRVVEGPYSKLFSPETYRQFFQQKYMLSPASNRIGYRLMGGIRGIETTGNMISFGMLPGAIQIPPNGEPIVMMADSPTTGGYPVIAVVIRADMPLLAQCEPQKSLIGFEPVTVEKARKAYFEQMERLRNIEVENQSLNIWGWAGSIQ